MKLKGHLVIAASGYHGVGKDTLIDELIRHFSVRTKLPTRKVSGSYSIVKSVADATGGNIEDIYKLKNENPLTRWILEHVGTFYMGNQDIIDNIRKDILAIQEPSLVFLTGVRTKLQEDFVRKEMRGILINIEHHSLDDRGCIIKQEEILPSEVEIEKLGYDYRIINDGTLLKFHKHIQYVYDWILDSRLFQSYLKEEEN